MVEAPPRGRQRVLAEVTGLGMEIAVAFGAPAYAGHLADGAWGTAPAGVLAGLALGLVLGGYVVVRTAKRLEETGEKTK